MQDHEILGFGGCKLFCRTEGAEDGPSIVFSHSLGCTLEMWDPQIAALADGFRIIRYDSRGHGRSDAPPGDYTIEMLGRDALAVFDAFGLQRSHFAGLSMGGMTGMWLGANAPERLDKLVLANTTARMAPTDWVARFAAVRANGLDDIAPSTMRRWFSTGFQAAHPGKVQAMIDAMSGMPVAGYIGSCSVLRDADLRGELGRIAAPTLVVAGDNYGAMGAKATEALAAAIANARLEVIADAAHLSNIENPDAFNKALVEFLDPERGSFP